MGSILADPPERLRAFVRDGRIAVLPAKRTRRRLLLDQVDEDFMSRTAAGTYWRSGGAVNA
jgi:hypothetical protein